MNSVTFSSSTVKIALDTLNERCQKLQIELNISEEENMKLKNKQNESKSSTFDNNEDDSLKEKYDQLHEENSLITRENNLLKKRLSLVTNENKQLWTKLSKLSETNNYLGNQLNGISSSLKKHSAQNTVSNEKKVISKYQNEPEGSLEEISLKIIHGILKEKQELESQCAEMTEIHNNFSSLTMSEFGISFYDPSESLLFEDLKGHLEKLNSFKFILKSQQDSLKTCTKNLEKIHNGNNICNSCKERVKLKSMMTSTECQTTQVHLPELSCNRIGEQEERICPLCFKIFPKNMQNIRTIDDYLDHVIKCMKPQNRSLNSLNVTD